MNFDQLKLLPGTALQLEFHQTSSDLREPSVLVGYLENQCIIVSIPLLNGEPKTLQQGELVDVTLYSDELNCAVMFSVQVLSTIAKPLAHAYLGFPAFIAKDEARKAQRIATSLVAKVKSRAGTFPAKIVDLSVSGCKLTSVEDLGPVESKLALVTKIKISGEEIIIQLRGVIKGVLAKPGLGGDVYEYGASFSEVTNEFRASLQRYIEQQSN